MAWENLELKPAALNLDVSPMSLPEGSVSLLSNMDFFAGVPRSLGALDQVAATSTPPITIASYTDGTASYIGYAGAAGAYAWTPSNTQVDIDPASGLTGSNYWDSCGFGMFGVFTNGKYPEAPHAISTTSTGTGGKLAPLPGWIPTASCKLIATHRNVLWAANLTEGGVTYANRVRWSTSAVTDALPSSWVVTPANDAGQVDLQFVGGEVLDMAAVGDVMYIGGTGGVWAARWVGGQYVYNFSHVNSQQGPRGIKCLANLGDICAMLTLNDLVIFDETSQQSIAVGRVSKLLSQFVKAELLYVARTRQLYVPFQLINETGYNHALIWDRDTDTFGIRDFQLSALSSGTVVIPVLQPIIEWDTDTGTWDEQVDPWQLAQNAEVNYIIGNAAGFWAGSNNPQPWLMQRLNIPAVGNDAIRLRSFEADLEGPTQNIWLRTGASMNAGDPVLWGEEKQFPIGGKVRNDDLKQGRYISWQLRGDGVARLNRVTLYYSPKGVKP